jgi:hypothetical protein
VRTSMLLALALSELSEVVEEASFCRRRKDCAAGIEQ